MTETGNTDSTEIALPRPSVHVSGVKTEYSLGRTPTGEWFALGTVRNQTARLVIGTGLTETDAVAQLTRNLNDRHSLA